MILAQKVRNQRVHACRSEKHGRIVIRNKGLALDLRMAFGFEKFYILRAKFVLSHKIKIANLRGRNKKLRQKAAGL